jgi:hypothetical protein
MPAGEQDGSLLCVYPCQFASFNKQAAPVQLTWGSKYSATDDSPTANYRTLRASHLTFSHPDYTVGPGISPDHAFTLAGFTAGQE